MHRKDKKPPPRYVRVRVCLCWRGPAPCTTKHKHKNKQTNKHMKRQSGSSATCRARVNWDPSSRPKSLASISSCSSTPLMRSSWSASVCVGVFVWVLPHTAAEADNTTLSPGTATLVCRTSVLLILETESLRRSERLTAMVSRLRSTVEYT